jgi:HEAT repeat protein
LALFLLNAQIMRRRILAWSAFLALSFFVLSPACQVTSGRNVAAGSEWTLNPGRKTHLQEVMTSAFCGKCHPAMYAEHNQNTHGRAFTDSEPRIATGRFAHSDCIRCHTPRPIFETGIGMNPMRRHHNLEEGNTCMTCHWTPEYDYGSFEGGTECKTAFHPDVGKVEACASCHRNHGTPYQWEKSPLGKGKNRTCMDCHMKSVVRPVAIGEEARRVRSHVFPGSRSESQLRRAYKYEARIDENELVVRVTNNGAGHNFPTELKQRSLESLVIVKDLDGKEVYRSRMIFRDPYKRPYGLHLLVNTQIPSGDYREHRVPIRIASGTVQTELHFKLYFPIEDNHPELARQLEVRQLPFDRIIPSNKTVESAPEPKVVKPEGTTIKEAGIPQLVDFAKLPIGQTEVKLPKGEGPEDIRKLIEFFMFPVPQAQSDARQRLLDIGKPAVPALVAAMGSWDNKTWKNAMKVLFAMGDRVRPDVIKALSSDRLYTRIHARNLLADFGRPLHLDGLAAALIPGLTQKNALDRTSAADALGRLKLNPAIPALRKLLSDDDPDVQRSVALALARLDDTGAVPMLRDTLAAASFVETRGDLAKALAMLGDPVGIPLLIEGLDHRDDLIREHFFERLFAVTNLHLGYDPLAPRPQRLEAISRLSAYWSRNGSAEKLRRPWPPSRRAHEHAWSIVQKLGDDMDTESRQISELVGMGSDAVPALVLGLKYPAGFSTRRDRILRCLGSIKSKQAAPFVAAALRDPVVAVASQACIALSAIKDPATLPALHYYHDHLLSTRAAGKFPKSAGDPDVLLARSAAARLVLGDKTARSELVNLLLADDLGARKTAHEALVSVFGSGHGYDAEDNVAARRAAARRWQTDSQK